MNKQEIERGIFRNGNNHEVNKQEIEKAIWQFNNNMTYKHDNLMFGEEYKQARQTIVNLLTHQLTNGWIPVSERLPEEDFNYYNVTMGKHGGGEGCIVEYCLYKQQEKKFYLVADGDDELNQAWEEEAKGIIAWQPLPEPYKEVSE